MIENFNRIINNNNVFNFNSLFLFAKKPLEKAKNFIVWMAKTIQKGYVSKTQSGLWNSQGNGILAFQSNNLSGYQT